MIEQDRAFVIGLTTAEVSRTNERVSRSGSPQDLAALLAGRRFAALTGAGCSTESGIPDYRGPETRRRATNPVQAREFLHSAPARARYWARSLVGWPRMAAARPNPAHRALAALEDLGAMPGVITQNVDGLHQASGSRRVIELHGALSRVRCLVCQRLEPRSDVQQRMLEANPGFSETFAEQAPDGDAEVPSELLLTFRAPSCPACGGALKPDVVFFGEGVPRSVVDAAFDLLDQAEALLVVGSSLAVYSGFRFVRRAHERGLPIGIVNLGVSRGDPAASLRVDAHAGQVLPELARRLAEAERTATLHLLKKP